MRANEQNTHVFRSTRSEEHTSELQSQSNLVCRLLLEKKKNSAKKSGMVNNSSSVNSQERNGLNNIIHDLTPLLTIHVKLDSIYSKNISSILIIQPT